MKGFGFEHSAFTVKLHMSMVNSMVNRVLTIANFSVLGVVILASFWVDGNGRIFGLSETWSWLVTVVFFTIGIGLSTLLIVRDSEHRVRSLICLIVYIVLCAPAVLPL